MENVRELKKTLECLRKYKDAYTDVISVIEDIKVSYNNLSEFDYKKYTKQLKRLKASAMWEHYYLANILDVHSVKELDESVEEIYNLLLDSTSKLISIIDTLTNNQYPFKIDFPVEDLESFLLASNINSLRTCSSILENLPYGDDTLNLLFMISKNDLICRYSFIEWLSKSEAVKYKS